jgi:hypothetical protein
MFNFRRCCTCYFLQKHYYVKLNTFRHSPMEQHAIKNVGNYLNNNIYSYLETSGGQSSNLNLNVVQFFNASVN